MNLSSSQMYSCSFLSQVGIIGLQIANASAGTTLRPSIAEIHGKQFVAQDLLLHDRYILNTSFHVKRLILNYVASPIKFIVKTETHPGTVICQVFLQAINL